MSKFESKSREPYTNIERVVGGSHADKDLAWDLHRSNVERVRSTRFDEERDLSEEEIFMLRRSENNVNRLRNAAGLPLIVITPEFLRAIDKEHVVIESENIPEGGYSSMMQTAFLSSANLSSEGVVRFDLVQHECIHIGQYQDMQFRTKERQVINYKSGLAVEALRPDDSGEYESYLQPLNEAVTEENARRFTLEISEDDPELGHLAKKRKAEFESFLRFCGENPEHGYPQTLLDGDMLSMEFNEETGRPMVTPFMYYNERQAMWRLFGKMFEKSPERFSGKTREEAKEEIFKIATKCSFTGNLMPLGRLMNDTFGPETFRLFGRVTTAEEFDAFVQKLEMANDFEDSKVEDHGEDKK